MNKRAHRAGLPLFTLADFGAAYALRFIKSPEMAVAASDRAFNSSAA
jgi:hypothetical protein